MKRYLALVLLGLVFLPFFALAENPEWTQYYLPLDRYPPIVFDGQIHEGASGPPGGALIQIEGKVLETEEFARHMGWYLQTSNGTKWALSFLSKEDEHAVLGERITVYGTYTGIAPVRVSDPNYGFMPSMRVIRYVLKGETVNPPVAPWEFYDDTVMKESEGKYRYEIFEGKTLSEIKELLGGLVLYHEHGQQR